MPYPAVCVPIPVLPEVLMLNEHSPHDDGLTDADLDAVVGGAGERYSCGLLKSKGDSSHDGKSPGHFEDAANKCNGTSGYYAVSAVNSGGAA